MPKWIVRGINIKDGEYEWTVVDANGYDEACAKGLSRSAKENYEWDWGEWRYVYATEKLGDDIFHWYRVHKLKMNDPSTGEVRLKPLSSFTIEELSTLPALFPVETLPYKQMPEEKEKVMRKYKKKKEELSYA